MKFKNFSSDDLTFSFILRVPGYLFLPREFAITFGDPSSSKNNFLRVDLSKRESGGMPFTSIMHKSCSASDSPGNNGQPECNSATIHPNDHISIAIE